MRTRQVSKATLIEIAAALGINGEKLAKSRMPTNDMVDLIVFTAAQMRAELSRRRLGEKQ